MRRPGLLVPASLRDERVQEARDVAEEQRQHALRLRQQHGRLVGRLKRDIERAERAGTMSGERARKMAATISDLIQVERAQADPLATMRPVEPEEVLARLRLMAPGGGLELPGEPDHGRSRPSGVILP
jgi:DNA-directed RNA polymerase subunit F